MCGIFGFLKTGTAFSAVISNAVMEGLYLTNLRGDDGSGVLWGGTSGAQYIKKPIPISDLIQFNIVKGVVGNLQKIDFLIAHARKATSGGISLEATHPFINKNISLVHNGKATQIYDEKWKNVISKYSSDSSWLASKLDSCTDKYIDFLSNLAGEYSLLWADPSKEEVYFCRNNSRPLYMFHSDEGILIASEEVTLDFIIKRNKLKGEEKDSVIQDVVPFTLYKFKEKKLSIEGMFKEVEPEKEFMNYSSYPARYGQYGYNYSGSANNVIALGPVKDSAISGIVSTIKKHKGGYTYIGLALNNKDELHFQAKTRYTQGDKIKGIICEIKQYANKSIYYLKDVALHNPASSHYGSCSRCYTLSYCSPVNGFNVCCDCLTEDELKGVTTQ